MGVRLVRSPLFAVAAAALCLAVAGSSYAAASAVLARQTPESAAARHASVAPGPAPAPSSQVPEPPVTPRQPKLPPGHERVVVLWPGGAPLALGRADVDTPRLFVYPAHTSATERTALRSPRTGIIVLPGGAYRTLMMDKEGATVARWLADRGVDAFVLQYRLGPKYHFPAPMLDGERAVRYVRSHAAELGVAPNKIGVWGFSAGGHLAGWLATAPDTSDPHSADPVDRVSDKPDFAILSYARLSMDPSIPRPTNLEALVGNQPSRQTLDTISIDRRVSKGTSPSLIFATNADEVVNSLNSTAFYNALKRAGVPAELHIFERGPHGIGLGLNLQHFPELAELSALTENWLQIHGWMEDRPQTPNSP